MTAIRRWARDWRNTPKGEGVWCVISIIVVTSFPLHLDLLQCPIDEELPVHHFHHSQMSSFRNHRVIIASLFLPSTVVVGESEPGTPERLALGNHAPVSIPAIAQRLARDAGKPLKSALSNKPSLQPAHNSHSRSNSATGAILSIVEDLRDKVRRYRSYRTR
jgi:hypothetical protein